MKTSDEMGLAFFIFAILIVLGLLFFKDSSPISVTQYDSQGRLIFSLTTREKAFSCTASVFNNGQNYTVKYPNCDGALELLPNPKEPLNENNT